MECTVLEVLSSCAGKSSIFCSLVNVSPFGTPCVFPCDFTSFSPYLNKEKKIVILVQQEGVCLCQLSIASQLQLFFSEED